MEKQFCCKAGFVKRLICNKNLQSASLELVNTILSPQPPFLLVYFIFNEYISDKGLKIIELMEGKEVREGKRSSFQLNNTLINIISLRVTTSFFVL